MGLIINPRGTAGSGKTTLVRRFLLARGWSGGTAATQTVHPVWREGRGRPVGFLCRATEGLPPVFVVGDYGRTRGGTDTFPLRDGGLAEVARLAAEHAGRGHHVLLEGLSLSRDVEHSRRLAARHPLHVLALATSPEQAAAQLIRRRRAGPGDRTAIAAHVAAEHAGMEAACAELQHRVSLHRLTFDAAYDWIAARLLAPDTHAQGAWVDGAGATRRDSAPTMAIAAPSTANTCTRPMAWAAKPMKAGPASEPV